MKNIKLVLLDVDGTLTDGKIYLNNNGMETKAFNIKDGMAIAQAIKYGMEIVIITGRTSKIVEIRSTELGIKEVYQGIKNKEEKVNEILKKKNIKLNEIAYVGDDINDLKIMKMVSFSACPNDAAKQVKTISNFISEYKGGEGAVREILELILEKKGVWKQVIEKYKGVNQ
jgi:3-deoxy-D-manno-octulosonate 8-phosphate phosphatase (KDO 8-P phosphatase)